MSEPAPDRIALTYDMTANDYAGYARAVRQRNRSWTPYTILVVVFFIAIPVALLFRSLAAQWSDDTRLVEMMGRFTVLAFGLGVIAALIGATINERIARKRYYQGISGYLGSRTVVLDHTGVTVSRPTSQWTWHWAAVRQCTCERELLLIWFEPAMAIVVPVRCFEDDGARKAADAFIRARLSEASAAPPAPAAAPT